ncbi:MAG: hypothetical protein WC756_14975 [Taibaiella sp.]|jgi:hypothetical protein
MIDHLKKCLGDCKKLKTSCELKTSYEYTNVKGFGVFDPGDNLPVKMVKDNSMLRVQNREGKILNFIKTDHCLLANNESKCDCIIFNEQDFYLVEIKCCKINQRKNHRKDAVKQLESTIKLLLKHEIDLSKYNKHAIICFKRVNTKPVMASLKSQSVLFKEKYGFSLKESGSIEF